MCVFQRRIQIGWHNSMFAFQTHRAQRVILEAMSPIKQAAYRYKLSTISINVRRYELQIHHLLGMISTRDLARNEEFNGHFVDAVCPRDQCV